MSAQDPILGGIAADGEVTVEGHVVGRLTGVHFEPARADTALEARALRGAVERAVGPEVARRLGELASETDEAFALGEDGVVAWRGIAAGEIAGGAPFKPRVRLIGEFGNDAARERAARRLEAFVASEASRRLAPLKHLTEAIADGRLRGLARGVAYQLVERFGVLDRRAADEHVRALSRSERRILKGFGVRFGAFSLYLPALLTAEALAIGAVFAHLKAPRWRPAPGKLSVLPSPAPPTEALSLRGLAAVGGLAIPVLALEKFDAMARAAPSGVRPDLIELTPAVLAAVGWTGAQADTILRSLGFVRVKTTEAAEASLWRRRPFAPRPPVSARTAPALAPATPGPAPARAADPPPAAAQKRRRRRPRHRSSPAAPRTTA